MHHLLLDLLISFSLLHLPLTFLHGEASCAHHVPLHHPKANNNQFLIRDAPPFEFIKIEFSIFVKITTVEDEVDLLRGHVDCSTPDIIH